MLQTGAPRVLLLTSDDSESRNWNELLRDCASLTWVKDLPALEQTLQAKSFEAVLCAWAFAGRHNWSDALESVRSRQPGLPVIVYSHVATDREWVTVVQAGAFDLVAAPYQLRTVLPILEHAVASAEAFRFQRTGTYDLPV